MFFSPIGCAKYETRDWWRFTPKGCRQSKDVFWVNDYSRHTDNKITNLWGCTADVHPKKDPFVSLVLCSIEVLNKKLENASESCIPWSPSIIETVSALRDLANVSVRFSSWHRLLSVAFWKIITALKSHMTCYNLNLNSWQN